MARKRMISPSMWESLSFSELSDFSKLVFISLISHADDEGRGMAKAATVTNVTFPNDENRRVADVKKALSEIALKMSVQFYSVDGREYYSMQSGKILSAKTQRECILWIITCLRANTASSKCENLLKRIIWLTSIKDLM